MTTTEFSEISRPGKLISLPDPDETFPIIKNLFFDNIFSASLFVVEYNSSKTYFSDKLISLLSKK